MTITTPDTASQSTQSGLIREYKLWLPAWVRRLPGWVRVGAVLLILAAASLYLRTKYVGGQFWMDEAITVGISSHKLSAIPGILRYDGSPPLFYLLLHVWMQMVGNGAAATHWLSEIFAVITVPVGYWAGLSIAGRRAGLTTATLFAFNAFLDYYSVETRMYALMTLLALLATIGFVHGFVFRRRRYVALFSVSQALMLYTHNWALFFAAATLLSLVVLYLISGHEIRKNLVKDTIFAYVGAAVLFVPWIHNFMFQVAHTAAPWDTVPRFGAPVQIAKSVFGGASITVVLLAGAAVGYSRLVTSREERVSREAKVVLMLVVIPALTLLVAWISSHVVTPAWDVRYFAPVVAPLVLLLAIGIARAGVLGALAIVFTIIFMARPHSFEPQYKSDMQDIAGELAPMLHRGDLVIVGQPESTPLAYYYLPAGLRWANTIGPVKDPSYMNWVDAQQRYEDSDPWKVLPPLLSSLKPGQQLLYIRPLTEGEVNWAAPWTELVQARSAQWGEIIAADKQLVPEATAPHNYRGSCCIADSAVLYKKI